MALSSRGLLKATLVNVASWSKLPTAAHREGKSVNTGSREEPDLRFVRDGRLRHEYYVGFLHLDESVRGLPHVRVESPQISRHNA